MPLVKIEAAARELKPLRDSQDQQTMYTGLKINGQWFSCKGDHRKLYNKTVNMEFQQGTNLCRLAGQAPAEPSQNGRGPAPTQHTALQAVQRIKLTAIEDVLGRIHRALPPEWAADVNGARAYAQVIQTVVKGILDGSVEIDQPALPEEHEPPEPDPWERGG